MRRSCSASLIISLVSFVGSLGWRVNAVVSLQSRTFRVCEQNLRPAAPSSIPSRGGHSASQPEQSLVLFVPCPAEPRYGPPLFASVCPPVHFPQLSATPQTGLPLHRSLRLGHDKRGHLRSLAWLSAKPVFDMWAISTPADHGGTATDTSGMAHACSRLSPTGTHRLRSTGARRHVWILRSTARTPAAHQWVDMIHVARVDPHGHYVVVPRDAGRRQPLCLSRPRRTAFSLPAPPRDPAPDGPAFGPNPLPWLISARAAGSKRRHAAVQIAIFDRETGTRTTMSPPMARRSAGAFSRRERVTSARGTRRNVCGSGRSRAAKKVVAFPIRERSGIVRTWTRCRLSFTPDSQRRGFLCGEICRVPFDAPRAKIPLL